MLNCGLEKKELWIYDEHYEKAMLTKDIYEMLVEKELTDTPITADSSERRLIQEPINKGIRRMRGSLKGSGSINQGILFIQGFKVYIHPRCENTVEEFNTYTFDQDKEGKWLNTPIDANNHIMDDLRYSLEQYHLGVEKKANTYKTLQNLGL